MPQQPTSNTGSRKASLALSCESSPKELVTLYQLDSWGFNCWDYPAHELVVMLHAMIMFWSTSDFRLDSSCVSLCVCVRARHWR